MPKAATRYLALHEAGHAIVGLRLKLTIERILFHGSSGETGETCFSASSWRQRAATGDHEPARAELAVDVAGLLAEDLFGGREVRRLSAVLVDGIHNGSQVEACDFRAAEDKAENLATFAHGKPENRDVKLTELRRAEALAEQILRANEDVLRNLAEALFQQSDGQMRGDRVRAIAGELT